MTEEQIAASLRRILNRHGYGFQYTVLATVNEFPVNTGWGKGQWWLRDSEIPVEVGGREFHIDGVLEYMTEVQPHDQLFVALECKRVNPSLASWVFAARKEQRAPIQDRYVCTEGGRYASACTIGPAISKVADIGIEVKGSGEGEDGNPRALKESVEQALRGAAGLAQRLHAWATPHRSVRIFPVVVTTAQLYWTSTPLDAADLKTGNFPDLHCEKINWLWLQQHTSRSLMPDVIRHIPPNHAQSFNPIRRELLHESARAVAITTVDGLAHFLQAIPELSADGIPG